MTAISEVIKINSKQVIKNSAETPGTESITPILRRELIVIYARHAEAVDSSDPNSPLTENGEKMADDFGLEFGRRLEAKGKPCLIKTNHNGLRRAEQTAERVEKILESLEFPHLKTAKPRRKEKYRRGADAFRAFIDSGSAEESVGEIASQPEKKLRAMRKWKDSPPDKLREMGLIPLEEIGKIYCDDMARMGGLLDNVGEEGATIVYLTITSEPGLKETLDILRRGVKTTEPIYSNLDQPFAGIDYLEYIELVIHKGKDSVQVSHRKEIFNAKRQIKHVWSG